MAMRETVGSLRAYFILEAVLGGIANLWALLRGEPALGIAGSLIGLGFAAANFYFGVRLRRLLSTAPRQITWFLFATAIFLVILFVLDLLSGMRQGTLIYVIIGLLITSYLFVNVERLAREAQSKMTGQAG
jgi:hypothetical protein